MDNYFIITGYFSDSYITIMNYQYFFWLLPEGGAFLEKINWFLPIALLRCRYV